MIAQLAFDLKVRPASMEDIPAMVELFNAYSRWLIGRNQHTVEDLTNEWNEPNFDPERDTQVVFNEQGQPVAYIEFWDFGEPHVKFNLWGVVLPEYHHQGIGSYLLAWGEERAQQALPLAQQGARVVLQSSSNSINESAIALLSKHGYQYARSFYHMKIEFNGAPPAPQLPQGITIRSIQPGEEQLAIRCAYDSFHDHWGFVEEPFENYLGRWMHMIENDKDYDPALYFMALEGERVAGVSLCYDHLTEDPEMAWVGTLGVRSEWRRRGLGLALLQHSFHAFYQRGKPRAGLGVDTNSLTGAVRLYERAGMAASRQFNIYQKELRPGIDLMTQTIRG